MAHPPEEIELKLLLAPANIAAFSRLALLKQHATAKPRVLRLRTTYFDTPDRQLRTHGLELRVRHCTNAWTQTLKTANHAITGLHQRFEWEVPVSGNRPELTSLLAQVGLGSTGAKVLKSRGLSEQLVPAFSNSVRRTVWPLRLIDGTSAELTLDQGELCAGNLREPISEVELELKSGHVAALFDFARQLQAQLPLHICNLSKAERGYALQAPPALVIATSQPVCLHPHIALETGFLRIAGNCLAQIQGNEIGVIDGRDPESVHQMRVGLRRFRSALRLFSRWMHLPAELRDELDWLGKALGDARDAEVLATSTLPALAVNARSRQKKWKPLQQAAGTAAMQKRHDAATVVESIRYARLMLALTAWLHGAGWRTSLSKTARAALQQPLERRAADRLMHLHKKLLKAGASLKKGSAGNRHRARIAAKRLRYASEFFESLYRSGPVRRYVRRLAVLQDDLGRLNDAVVADGLLRRIAKTGDSAPALVELTHLARKTIGIGTRKDQRELQTHWKRFKKVKLPGLI